MALTPAIKLNFDGQDPWHLNGLADNSGVFHYPVIKQGSNIIFRLHFPLITNVAEYFWITHFRSPANSPDAYYTALLSVPGQTDSNRSSIVFDPANLAQGLLFDIDADEVSAAGTLSGSWDLEAWRWNTVNDFTAGFANKDRVVEGTYEISQGVTRETFDTIPGVGV